MPQIKHSILSWARETSKLSIESAASKLNITNSNAASAAGKLAAFENGTKAPSRSLLLRMAKIYRQPLLTFYLDRPPEIGDRGEDFRTLPDHFDEKQNAYVDVLVRDIKARQSTIRETLIDEDEGIKLSFIGKYTIEHGVADVVQALQNILNLDLVDYRSQSNNKEAFKFLRQHAEAAGIFVILKGDLGSHHTDISVKAFRGFALSDNIAPFVVINNRDAESAWSFTLMHEIVHLILGQTGISGTIAENSIEKFCNNVSSEFMLPQIEFDSFRVSVSEIDVLKNEISNYAASKKLSSTHIAYRLYRRGDIDKSRWEILREYYHQKWRELRQTAKERNQLKSGGPSYYVVRRHRLGALVELVQRLTYSGALTTTKAGMLLDVRPLKVHRLFRSEQPA